MYTMCPPGYYHNRFMATPELGHGVYGSLCWIALWGLESLQTASSEQSKMPIDNTSYKALHPIHRVLRLYKNSKIRVLKITTDLESFTSLAILLKG